VKPKRIGAPLTADERRLLLAQLGRRQSTAPAGAFVADVENILQAAARSRPVLRDAHQVRAALECLQRECDEFSRALASVERPVVTLLDAYRGELHQLDRFAELALRLQSDVDELAAAAGRTAQAFARGRGERDRDARRAALREHLAGAYLRAFPGASIKPKSTFDLFVGYLATVRELD
jgi:hypothetical protein